VVVQAASLVRVEVCMRPSSRNIKPRAGRSFAILAECSYIFQMNAPEQMRITGIPPSDQVEQLRVVTYSYLILVELE
jgi:hypothetical protein